MLLDTLLTAGSKTHTFAPTFTTDEAALANIPENIDVIMTIKKTAKVIPINSAENLPLSLTRSLSATFNMPNTQGLYNIFLLIVT